MKKASKKGTAGRKRVNFSYQSEASKDVILMGDFNSWNQKTHPMKSDGKGLWKKIVMLFPGRYE